MSVFTMMAPLLRGVDLTPGQVAELRAIDALCHTRVFASSGASSESSSALDELVLTRVRDMLQGEQRIVFDRNREARQTDQARDSDRTERYR